MSEEERKERINYLWSKARAYNERLCFKVRLQKMAESSMKELMTDEFPEEMNEANLQIEDNHNNSPWYLIDSDKSFCKFWDFFITILILYELIVVPFVLVFPDLY